MSTPSDRDQPPSTQEIPVAPPSAPAAPPLPPHPQAIAPVAPVSSPVSGPQPTGPVDFVPGLPGVGTPPPPPPAAPPTNPATAPATAQPADAPGWPDSLESEQRPSARQKARVPIGQPALIGMGLALLAVVLLELGLLLGFSSVSYWSAVPLWSAFATLAAVVGLVAVVAGTAPGSRLRPGTAWRIAAGGFAGLAVFWVLVVLPNVASDRGFVLTAALGCLGGAVWMTARGAGAATGTLRV